MDSAIFALAYALCGLYTALDFFPVKKLRYGVLYVFGFIVVFLFWPAVVIGMLLAYTKIYFDERKNK